MLYYFYYQYKMMHSKNITHYTLRKTYPILLNKIHNYRMKFFQISSSMFWRGKLIGYVLINVHLRFEFLKKKNVFTLF